MLEIRDYQQVGADWLREKKSAMLADQMGCGKFQDVETPTLTPYGWVRMGDIKVGDLVVGQNGEPTEVLAVYPQGEQELVDIEFSDGATTTAGWDHLWEVNTPSRKKYGSSGFVLSTQEIVARGLKSKAGNSKWFIPMVDPVKFSRGANLKIDPYLLGVLLGDGSISGRGVKLSTDIEIVENLILPPGVSVGTLTKNKTNAEYHCEATLTGGMQELLRELGLMGTSSESKFIPEEYLYSAVEDRIALLQGLLDTDGTAVSSRGALSTTIEFGTISKRLAYQVQGLVQSLGGACKVRKKTPTFTHKGVKKEGQTFYRMNPRLPEMVTPFRLSRKKHLWVPRSKYQPTRAIVRVTPIGKREAVCIKVSDPRHLYVTEQFIVTHNTCTAITASVGKTLVVAPAMLIESKMWAKEIEKWADDPSRFSTISYTMLWDRKAKGLRSTVNQKWDTVVFDEGHHLKNISTSKYRAAKKLRALTDRCYILTGTPIPNWPQEIYGLLTLIFPEDAKPGGNLGSKWRWISDWFVLTSNRHNHNALDIGGLLGCTHALGMWEKPCKCYLDFASKNFKDRYLARGLDDIGHELPPITEITVNVPMTPKQWQAYGDIKKKGVIEVAGNEVVSWTAASAHVVADRIQTGLYLADGVIKAEESGKLEQLRDDLENRTGPVIVMAHYRTSARAAEHVAQRMGLGVARVDGGTSPAEKAKIVEDFQNGKLDVLVGTLEVLAEGLTLTNANTVIFLEQSWKPSRNEQAKKRVHRIGQTKPCFIRDYVAVGPTGQATLDVHKREVLAQKTDSQIKALTAAQMVALM